MRGQEIEVKARRVIDRVLRGEMVEDALVECKREWTVHCARQLAGHANAARGAPILWLIGLDEKTHEIAGADLGDFEQAWSETRGMFSERFPEPAEVRVDTDVGSVVAVQFDTSEAPYLYKVPGSDRLEVPWRASTRTRSARRGELLEILVPARQRPRFEQPARAELKAMPLKSKGPTAWLWTLDVSVYADVDAPVVLPDHLSFASVACATRLLTMRPLKLRAPHTPMSFGHARESFIGGGEPLSRLETVHQGSGQITLTGPGWVHCAGRLEGEESPESWGPEAKARVDVAVVGVAGASRLDVALGRVTDLSGGEATAVWRLAVSAEPPRN